MDGYIKNKQEALRSVRRTILWKYAISFPILALILTWLFGIYSLGSPEDWKSTDIVYSHISRERIGLQRGDSAVLNTIDGRKYVLPARLVSAARLEETLIAGESYSLVYEDTIAGGSHMKALHNDRDTFLDRSASVAAWEKERRNCFLGLYITVGLEILALILIDRLWCRTDHRRIAKLHQDIEKRKQKYQKYN